MNSDPDEKSLKYKPQTSLDMHKTHIYTQWRYIDFRLRLRQETCDYIQIIPVSLLQQGSQYCRLPVCVN